MMQNYKNYSEVWVGFIFCFVVGGADLGTVNLLLWTKDKRGS